MAKRRCISIDIFENEKFLSLNDKSKVLYVGLLLHTDDDGVIVNPKIVMRVLKKNPKYFDELLENGFIMRVDDIYVIKHFNMHNKIQPSKKTPSLYQTQLSKLCINQRKEYEFSSEKIRNFVGTI
ncbi:MAG: hypothetical protein IKB73_04415 [Ruminococcus sp.]|nr:hypothetical protein [Ruminococcus sp.]